jgi:hypothetical protein
MDAQEINKKFKPYAAIARQEQAETRAVRL